MSKRKTKRNLTEGPGIHLCPYFFGGETKIPNEVVGIRAPEEGDKTPGGLLLFGDGTSKPAKEFGLCVCNFSYYGQEAYACFQDPET